MLHRNPIVKIHDQGAGGMANVAKEIIEPHGASINIDNVILGDKTMTPLKYGMLNIKNRYYFNRRKTC